MPIYEYRCQKCQKEFELLVRSTTVAACPFCQSEDLIRRMSAPAGHVSSESGGGCCHSQECPGPQVSGCGCSGGCCHHHG